MRETLESRVAKRMDRKKADVFVRADFSDLGGYDQVGRVLREFVRAGRLMRIGSGLYARTRPSVLTGRPTPVKGFRELGEEALNRLGIETFATQLERDYSAGRTTQVPNGRVIAIRQRVRRKIGYNGVTLRYERA